MNPTTATSAPAPTNHHEYRAPYAITGKPTAATSGQKDGLGRWIAWPCLCPSAGWSDAPAGTRTNVPSLSSTYLRCQHSSIECTTRISSKLYVVGAIGVAHA